jgi:hypothetical protein
MPTKKGKSKPAKARKTSNKTRRTVAAGGGPNRSKRAGGGRGTGASARSGGRKRAAPGMRRTEAGPVWIGSSPAPLSPPTGEPGDNKAGTGESDRVVIL